jgi:hypothetical protein
MKLLPLLFIAAIYAHGQDIDSIMSRVAINQAKSQDLRTSYVYTQKQFLRMMRSNGKLAREERREYTVTPLLRRTKKHLVHFEGRYADGGDPISFDRPSFRHKGMDLDGELIDSFSQDTAGDRNSPNGIAHHLFPLTYHQQLKYDFKLLGSETYKGREAWRVSFKPKPKMQDALWKGQALIDKEEYQPLLITTDLSYKIPLVVKTLLGTNIKGLGFTVAYNKFEDGVWFPTSYGGEFEFHGLFLYRRKMSVSLVNSDFRKLDVNSSIAYATEDK